MSPTNKKKLNQIRIKLDKLDNDLLKLIKKRSSLVNEVLKVKIYKKDTPTSLAKKVLRQEHKLYPAAIKKILRL